MPAKTETIDLAVVGAGPCGLAVGIAGRREGLRTVLFDRGCVVNSLVGYPLNMTFFSTPENLEIGGLPFVCRGEKPTRGEALKYYRRVADHYELDVRQYEEVLGIERTGSDFRVTTRPRNADPVSGRARRVVIATGSFGEPNRLDVPGEDLDKVSHYFREAHPYYDQDCLVVGGGNSAVETALELYRVGARVTLVHFLDRLDPGVKPWVRPDIENRIEEGSIVGRFESRVVEIEPKSVTVRDEASGSTETLRNDWVFAMTGYRPESRLLRELGVMIDEESGVPHHDPETMETDVPGVYVAGVLAAGFDANRIFIENGRHHGGLIVRHLTADGRS